MDIYTAKLPSTPRGLSTTTYIVLLADDLNGRAPECTPTTLRATSLAYIEGAFKDGRNIVLAVDNQNGHAPECVAAILDSDRTCAPGGGPSAPHPGVPHVPQSGGGIEPKATKLVGYTFEHDTEALRSY